MDRQPSLETARLLIRPMGPEDREALYAVAGDPSVWEQHPAFDRSQRPVFDALFDEGLASGGALTIIEKATDTVIGSTRFDRFDSSEGGAVELGWTYLAPRYWGTGRNAEMKRALLAHAFEQVNVVEFRVGDTNYRSRNALDAIGAVRTDRYELARYRGKRVVHLIYEITREEFFNGPLMNEA